MCRHHIRLCLIILFVGNLSGCSGESWHARTFPVEGTIFINDTVPEGLVVLLKSTQGPVDSRGSTPYGTVGSDGRYRVGTYEFHDGAPTGEYAVVLNWPIDPKLPSGDRLKNKYNSLDKSPLSVTIIEGENTIPEIRLDKVKILPAQDLSKSLAK